MVFLFILDVVTSLTLRIVVNCGFWIVCKSANGVHYIYKKIMPSGGDECPSNPSSKEGVRGATSAPRALVATCSVPRDDTEYIIITRDEYERLKTGTINVLA